MSELTLVLATANPDKAEEVRAILTGELGPRLVLLARPSEVAEVEEIGSTLEENARLKAAALVGSTGLPAIADDTGLEVAALGGAPGVFSARYAGEHATYAANVEKLLAELAGRPDRRACFSTVALALFPDGTEIAAEGVVDGEISLEPKGDGGFGYDPVFVPSEGDGRTFAEMSPAEKHALSHRGRAFRLLAARLAETR
ncbi:MAG: RdgB/HAM1 family non-canonical purine NTP pyrophosphatase [Acidimicrobiales bacterium]